MEVKVENVSYLIERSDRIYKSNGLNKELLLQDINLNFEPGSVSVFVGNVKFIILYIDLIINDVIFR